MKKIILSKEIGTNVVTRNILDRFFSKLERYKSKEIVVDFSDIVFISRSSADEFIKLKNSTRKKIKEINQSENIKQMFEVVTNKIDAKQDNQPIPVRICTI